MGPAANKRCGGRRHSHVFPHWVNHEMTADNRSARRPHLCLPTVSQQWVQLARRAMSIRCTIAHSGAVLCHRCLFRRLLDDDGKSFHWCPCRLICDGLWGTHLWLVQLHQKSCGSFHTVRINWYVPEHTPLAFFFRVGQNHQVRFACAASQHPIDNRRRTSAPQLCPVRHAGLGGARQQAIDGSLHPHRWDGRVVLLKSFIIGQGHVIERDQSPHETSFHVTNADQP